MDFDLTIKKAGQFNSNFLPDEANGLRWLYETSGRWSHSSTQEITKREIATRIFGLATIPAALLYSAYFASRAFFRVGACFFTERVCEAVPILLEDTGAALRCLVLSVTNIAFAILGLFYGHLVYEAFIPIFKEMHTRAELMTSKNTLSLRLKEMQETFQVLNEQIKTVEQTKINCIKMCNEKQNELNKYRYEINSLKKIFTNYTKQIEELENKLSSLNQKEILEKSMANQSLQIKAQEIEIEALHKAASIAQTELIDLLKKNETMTHNNEVLLFENKGFNQRLYILEEDIKKLHKEKNELIDLIKIKDNEINKLIEEINESTEFHDCENSEEFESD